MHLSARHDKHDKTVSCFSPNTFGNGTVNDAMVCNSTTSDVEAHAPPEKVNMETFELPRILLQLSRKEKEDDFLAMKGTKLSQRPKKRPKNVERVLQNCFPGKGLSDLTRERYEVREKKCTKKKPRGLKAHAPPEKVNIETFELPRILLQLSLKEIEDDFLAIKGTKLSQRPKKRPKNVERVLQNCFPGKGLSDLTRERYEVREKKCTKKPRGLKAMESSDSESD